MKILSSLILFYLILLCGCSVTDPEIPDGYNSYEKGGIPEATLSIQELYQRKALINIHVGSTGGRKLISFYLCLSETNMLPDTTDRVVNILPQYDQKNGTFVATIPELEAATNYYCRAYLANLDEGAYTDNVVFNTKVPSDAVSWKEMRPLPADGHFYQAGFTVNNRAFAISSFWDLGMSDGGNLLEYLPAGDEWVRRADLPTKKQCLPISIVINDKAYVGLGDSCERFEDGSTRYYPRQDWWCYDSGLDKWTRKADFPLYLFSRMTAFSIGGKGYVVIGPDFWNSSPMYVYEYDPMRDSWSRKRDFPGKKLQHPNTFVIDGRVFVFTGTTDSDNSLDSPMEYTTYMWEYIPETDTWLRRADFKGGGREWMIATSLNGIGYAGFGAQHLAGNYFTNVMDWWCYNPDTDKWSQRNIHEGWLNTLFDFAFVVDGSIYAVSREHQLWKYQEEK